jgi:hypothetical protein
MTKSLGNKFTGLVVTWQDNTNFELSLLEQSEGTYKVEDDILKIDFLNRDGVETQMGFPLTSFRCYEIYHDRSDSIELEVV